MPKSWGKASRSPWSVEITTGDAIASFTDADAKASVNRVLEGNVDSLVDQLVPALNGIAEKFVRSAAKRGVKDAVTEQVKNFLKQNDPDVTDERVAALLEKAGFTDAYIAEQTDKIFDAVYEDGATVDSVSQKAADTVEEVFKKLEESGESRICGRRPLRRKQSRDQNHLFRRLSRGRGRGRNARRRKSRQQSSPSVFARFRIGKRRLPFRGDAFVGKGSRFGGFRSRGGRRGGA